MDLESYYQTCKNNQAVKVRKEIIELLQKRYDTVRDKSKIRKECESSIKSMNKFELTERGFRQLYGSILEYEKSLPRGEEFTPISKRSSGESVATSSSGKSRFSFPNSSSSTPMTKTPSKLAFCTHSLPDEFVYIVQVDASVNYLKIGSVEKRSVEERLKDYLTICPNAKILFSMRGCSCMEKLSHELLRTAGLNVVEKGTKGEENFICSLDIAISTILLAKQIVISKLDGDICEDLQDATCDDVQSSDDAQSESDDDA